MECCVANITSHGETLTKFFIFSNKYVIAQHIPISLGYMWQGIIEDVGNTTSKDVSQAYKFLFNTSFKYNYGLECIEIFARDLLLETNSK